MRRIGIAVWVLLVIVLTGLPAGVQADGGDDGLVAEWHFDEGSGSVLVDSSGNGNDGVIHGATWVKGVDGKALRFDGRGDYVEVPYSSSLDISDAITITAWTYWNSLGTNSVGVIGKAETPSQTGWGLGKGHWSGGKIGLYPGGLGDGFRAYPTSDIPTGQWVFYAGTFDETAVKIYMDGTLNNDVRVSGSVSTNSQPVVVGRWYGNYDGYYFNGIIDEIRIYNRALTADEIKSHYEGQQTALSLTKSAAPYSIKQGQTTTVTLTITNTGTTEITDIEVADTIPSDLTFTSGEISKTYTSLRPKDSREFQYTLQLNESGTFDLDPATATYANEEENYHTAESGTATITVIPSTGTTPAPIIPTHRATTAISITKSSSLNSIRQFGETVITLSIENSGTTDVTDIEITDRVHPSFDLTSGDFPNPKRYDLIRPGETRDLQYTISSEESGTFTLDPATVTYADADGNIQEAESEPYIIRVVPSASGSAAGASHHPSSISTASVHLHGEKTDVVMGEDILLKLSAVNKITKPTMTLQVILIPPSGMSVTSADFVKSGAGLYTSTYVIEPGIGRDIEVGIRSNQVGDFVVNGEVIYYFGDDKENAEEHLLSLPITVRARPDSQQDTSAPTATSKDGKGVPEFEAVLAAAGGVACSIIDQKKKDRLKKEKPSRGAQYEKHRIPQS
ncbi:MAG: LamG-like jellyroll fold domain-containing protein [Euryarchaeota archaeon]|nr:LamG-like jellyroll fold domain-containing protein [Euryarchaeota archaeon]